MILLRTVLVLLLCVCGAMCGPIAQAQQGSDEGDIPNLILAGLESYKRGGSGEAIRVWLRGSAIENQEAISQAHVLHQVEELYGPYESYEPITTRDLTPSVRIIYMAMDYSKGPLFAKFVVYRTDQGWIMTSFLFNTNEAAVLPAGY